MEWLPSSPVLNPNENKWSIVKMELYEGGKQYDSKADLWEAIKTTMIETEPSERKKNLNQSIIDYWLLLRRRVTRLNIKNSKTYHVFVICSIIGVDQFLMILFLFY